MAIIVFQFRVVAFTPSSFVDLAKIADRFHVATVHSEDESVFRCDNSHEPLPA